MSQTATGPRQCDCQHHDKLTCQSARHRTSAFNALITYGECMCPCHRDAAGLPISEQAWRPEVRVRAKNREAYRNLKQHAAKKVEVAR